MLRQASSRNHRSKGFKVKNALQICLLIAICIWLLYQIKHSHEKKKAFEERKAKNSNKEIENPEDFFKLGRKDLPRIDETISENETHKEDENEEAQEEEPATKRQEEIEDDEGRGDGVDDIDEQDQEKGEEEAENVEESSPEEGDNDNSHDEMDLFDNHEHEEGGSQEAREENYKRDDASSAVVHDTLATESENGDGDERSMDEQVVDKAHDESNDDVGSKQMGDSSTVDSKSDEDSNGDVDPSANGSKGEATTENLEKKIVESENATNGTDNGSTGDTVLKDDEMADNKNIEADNKDLDIEVSKPGNWSVANSTIVEDKSQMEQKDNSSVSADDIAGSNNTINSHLAQDQRMEVDGATQGETKEYSTTSSSTNENGDGGHEESENLSHAVVTEEEKVDITDLSTLPDIQSEVKSTDGEAAE